MQGKKLRALENVGFNKKSPVLTIPGDGRFSPEVEWAIIPYFSEGSDSFPRK